MGGRHDQTRRRGRGSRARESGRAGQSFVSRAHDRGRPAPRGRAGEEGRGPSSSADVVAAKPELAVIRSSRRGLEEEASSKRPRSASDRRRCWSGARVRALAGDRRAASRAAPDPLGCGRRPADCGSASRSPRRLRRCARRRGDRRGRGRHRPAPRARGSHRAGAPRVGRAAPATPRGPPPGPARKTSIHADPRREAWTSPTAAKPARATRGPRTPDRPDRCARRRRQIGRERGGPGGRSRRARARPPRGPGDRWRGAASRSGARARARCAGSRPTPSRSPRPRRATRGPPRTRTPCGARRRRGAAMDARRRASEREVVAREALGSTSGPARGVHFQVLGDGEREGGRAVVLAGAAEQALRRRP